MKITLNWMTKHWHYTPGLPWMMANSESFLYVRLSSALYICHLILTITQTGLHHCYYPILQVRTLRLRQSIWRTSSLEHKHGCFFSSKCMVRAGIMQKTSVSLLHTYCLLFSLKQLLFPANSAYTSPLVNFLPSALGRKLHEYRGLIFCGFFAIFLPSKSVAGTYSSQ